MFKKMKVLMICSVLLLCLILPFESNAAVSTTNEFYVKYPEPTCDEFSGYLFVSYWNSATQQNVSCCYLWRMTPSWQNATESGVDIETRMNIEFKDNGQLTFTPWTSGSSTTVVQFGLYNADDNYRIKKNSTSVSNDWSFADNYSQYPINGYVYGGNVGYIKGASAWDNVDTPIIHYSNSVDAKHLYYRLQQVLDELSLIEGDTSTIISKLENIYNQNVSTNRKLDNMNALLKEIKAEQVESNTWLEKIFNWLKDSPEQEKQEATTQGNNSVSDGTNAIEDKGQGFTDSMGGLINSMSYNGTECSWTFPTVKLPAISGVMEERVLIQNQDIDFGFWINSIPSNIMLLIRSVLTMALIVYCFKELYDTISYVLTLRGSNNE